MASGYCKLFILGNLGADPELRATQGGTSVLGFRVATTETFLDRNKVKQERTEWHSCTVWGARAEGLAKILKKGDRVFCEGSLRTREWEKDGQKHYKTEVNVNEVVLCGGKPGGPRPAASRDQEPYDPVTGEVGAPGEEPPF